MGDHHQPTAHDAARRRDTATPIARLPHDVPPVRRLWSPPVRLASWLALEVLIAGCALLVLGERPDLAPRLASPGFATQSDCSSRPEWRARCSLCSLPCPCASRDARSRSAPASQWSPNRDAPRERRCEPAGKRRGARGLAVRGAHARGRRRAMVILLLAVRGGATLVPARAGLLAGAATLLVAAAVIRVVCPSDERWHLLVFHLGPVVLGIMASLAMGLRCTSAGAAADDASTARFAKPCVPDVRRQARRRHLDCSSASEIRRGPNEAARRAPPAQERIPSRESDRRHSGAPRRPLIEQEEPALYRQHRPGLRGCRRLAGCLRGDVIFAFAGVPGRRGPIELLIFS